MKVLSILQPWASLIVLGHKKIETRSWNTNYRGELLIHASLSLSNNQKQLLQQEPFHSCLKHLRMLRDDFVRFPQLRPATFRVNSIDLLTLNI